MTRLKAAGLHLFISLLLVTATISLMLAFWYPNVYFKLMGGKALLLLIGSVDVFIGPLLTLIVFKSGKKSLKFDLSCIALLQIAAMGYGLNVMFEARPVFTVFNKNHFQVVSVVDIDSRELALGRKSEWRTLSITGPRLVAIGTPDKSNKEEVIFANIVSARASQYPKLYDDYNNHHTEIIKAGKPLPELLAIDANNREVINKFLEKTNRPATDFLFLPVESMVDDMAAIVDAKTGELIQLIDAKTIKITE